MSIELGYRRLNPRWDHLLTDKQRQLINQPGFGLSQQLPYQDEQTVKEIMDMVADFINEVEERIKSKAN